MASEIALLFTRNNEVHCMYCNRINTLCLSAMWYLGTVVICEIILDLTPPPSDRAVRRFWRRRNTSHKRHYNTTKSTNKMVTNSLTLSHSYHRRDYRFLPTVDDKNEIVRRNFCSLKLRQVLTVESVSSPSVSLSKGGLLFPPKRLNCAMTVNSRREGALTYSLHSYTNNISINR